MPSTLSARPASKLPLAKGGYTLVDPEMRPYLEADRWFRDKHGYARRTKSPVLLHRLVYKLAGHQIEGKWVTHINGDRLDNRLDNLKVASRSQCQSRRMSATRASGTGVLGISYEQGSWRARVSHNRKHWSRSFSTLEEAIHHRNLKAIEIFGEDAAIVQMTPEEIRQKELQYDR